VTTLADRLRTALDEAEINPLHQLSCQMLKTPPPGFPFATFSCNCDGPGERLRMVAAYRKILDEHRPSDGFGHCEGCGADYQEEPRTPNIDKCPTLLALAEGLGIAA
jgi:hypothetical protein